MPSPKRLTARRVDQRTFVDILTSRAGERPSALAYAFLAEGQPPAELTYAELDRRARSLAAHLIERGATGNRVLLQLQPGLDYVVGIYACLYAGVVAVPAYPARRGHRSAAVEAIATDSGASFALVDEDAGQPREGRLASLTPVRMDDGASADLWRRPSLRPDQLALLQYTSGSTAAPRGAKMSQEQLLLTADGIVRMVRAGMGDTGVSWLPLYHDMGLFGGIFLPMMADFSMTLLSPLAFLQRPMRWLEVLSRLGGTISGAPNFAYDLCVEASRKPDLDGLDLSRWRTAVTGAEPVRAETINRFVETFGPAGFRRSTFVQAYGMAEGLPLAAGRLSGRRVLAVETEGLGAGRVRPAPGSTSADKSAPTAITNLVSCGRPIPGVHLAIVDPVTGRPAGRARVGEIWATGELVAHGYWGRPGDTRKLLRAHLDGDDRDYLRTGDLGFIRKSELYVTGRRKELLIIRGRNYYPIDIERTAEAAHPDIRRSGVAAVGVQVDGEERLAVVAELRRRTKADPALVIAAIRRAVAEEHDLGIHQVGLLSEGRLPRTSSGKTQRLTVRRWLAEGSLPFLAAWTAGRATRTADEVATTTHMLGAAGISAVRSADSGASTSDARTPVRSAAEIERWLINQIAGRLGHDTSDVEPERPFLDFGLGSAEATALAGELATWLERPLSPTLTWEYPTIARLARFLADGAALPAEFPAGVQEPIAIIGVGIRFPDAPDLESFRDLLRNGRDAIRPTPLTRWNMDDFYDPNPAAPGKIVTRSGGFLESIDGFDPQFFSISPREAAKMDPQQRLLLEVTEEALEHAAIAPADLSGTATGVFVGIGAFEYTLRQIAEGGSDSSAIDVYTGTGNAHSIAANRISFLYDLHGPSVALDTACSSSLVAIHMACQSLLTHESDAALAGGVNLIVSPMFSIALSSGRMLSPEGLCKSFDATADGYVRSEGAGMIVLKRLSDARRDGDRILALIRGSAVNQDGLTSGITAPNGRAQQDVLRTALARAGIKATELGAIEAHGTGTPLGDPIEVNALAEVIGPAGPGAPPIWLSSVKANVGHLEVASGMAGLAKVLLELAHGEIYAQAHFYELNPLIRMDKSPLRIPRQIESWATGARPRYAGISSFGFGGTNAHLIVEEAREAIQPRSRPERPTHLVTISAKTEPAMRRLAELTAEALAADSSTPIEDVAFTANTGRGRHLHRAAVVASTTDELRTSLTALAESRPRPNIAVGRRMMQPPTIAFLYTGQGAQYRGMGQALYDTQPTFRAALDRCAELLEGQLDRPLLSVMFAANGEDLLNETAYAQPALFALEYAMTQLWKAWGIEPDAVIGHSVGEYVAACVAGALSLEDAIPLVAARGRLMQALPRGGAMAAVVAPLDRVTDALAGQQEIVIAGINGPENITISGAADALQRIVARLEADGVSTMPVTVSHAFHSPLIEPMLDEFEALAGSVRHDPLRLWLAANLTGQLLAPGATLDARYWRDHARNPVRFDEGIRALHEYGAQIFIEVGPSPILSRMGARSIQRDGITWAASLKAGQDEWQTLLTGLSVVYAAGRDVDWAGFDADYTRRRVTLPSYPFERSPYWYETDENARLRPGSATGDRGHPIARTVLGSPYPAVQARLATVAPPFLGDHHVQGSVVVPGTMLIELMLTAATAPGEPLAVLEDVEFERALFLTPGAPQLVQAIVTPDSSGRDSVRLLSRPEGSEEWTLCARATVGSGGVDSDPAAELATIEVALARCVTGVPREEFYPYMATHGLEYGPSFQALREMRRRSGEAIGFMEAPALITDDLARYHLHPALLDAAVQTFAVVGRGDDINELAGLYLPVGLRRLRVHRPLPARFWAHAQLLPDVEANSPTPEGDIRVVDEEGNLILEIEGWRVQQIDTGSSAATRERIEGWLYEIDWSPMAQAHKGEEGRVAASAPGAAARSWLVLAGSSAAGPDLAAHLRSIGNTVRLAVKGDRYRVLSDDNFMVRTGSRTDLEELWRSLAASGGLPDAVVCLWPLDAGRWDQAAPAPPPSGAGNGAAPLAGTKHARRNGSPPASSNGTEPSSHEAVADLGGGGVDGTDVAAAALAVTHLVQALSTAASDVAPCLVIVTSGAEAGVAGGDERTLLQAPVTGLARVIRAEHPELQSTTVDIDPEAPDPTAALAGLLVELGEAGHLGSEPEVALRGGERLVRRLVRLNRETIGRSDRDVHDDAAADSEVLRAPSGPYRLESTAPGMLDKLALRPAQHRVPGPGEVEIQVLAAGVNFRDVMKALGVYPGSPADPMWLGDEIAGRIVAVGEGVHLELGQEVFGAAPAAFGSFASTRADYVLPMPRGLTFDDAATLPVCFTTALYALEHLARLQAGESVLIHAAAGGVGQAAIQIARAIGAEVYATASEGKHDFLRSCGVTNIFDSRTLRFAKEIREATGGRGVDVVLNHLAGDFIPASMSTLAPYGRFIEIGKRDIFANSKIGLRPFRNNLSFFAVDMDRLSRDRPAIYRGLLAEVATGIEAGQFTPLPRTVFPMSSAVSAFRYLAQAKNIGKVVLSLTEASVETDSDEAGLTMHADATYLVTGGLRGLGARVAEWLALMGARHLVLIGRDPTSAAARDTAQRLEQAGASTTLLAVDVGDEDEVAEALAQIRDTLPPLRGIVHAAGILADGILDLMGDEQFRSVFGAKAAGALHLHRATKGMDLDFFIGFSSAASLMGNPGQGNYAAANAFLDRLAFLRRAQGLVGQSINWGPWSEIGMSTVTQGQRSFEFGVGSIPPDRGVEALAHATRDGRPEIAVMPMDWARFISRVPGAATDPLLEAIRRTVDLNEGQGPQSVGLAADAILTAAPEEQQQLIEQFVRVELARVLQLDADALPLDQPLNTVGLDSLMALELKNRVEGGMGVNLPIVSLIQGPSISELSAELVDRLRAARGDRTAGRGQGVSGEGAVPGEVTPSDEALQDMLDRAISHRARV